MTQDTRIVATLGEPTTVKAYEGETLVDEAEQLSYGLPTDIDDRIRHGDEDAERLYERYAIEVSKRVCSLLASTSGRADRIVLTGPLSSSRILTGSISFYAGFIAPIEVG